MMETKQHGSGDRQETKISNDNCFKEDRTLAALMSRFGFSSQSDFRNIRLCQSGGQGSAYLGTDHRQTNFQNLMNQQCYRKKSTPTQLDKPCKFQKTLKEHSIEYKQRYLAYKLEQRQARDQKRKSNLLLRLLCPKCCWSEDRENA